MWMTIISFIGGPVIKGVMPPLHEWRGFVALSGHRFSTLNRKLGTETFSLCPRRMAQIGQQEEDREP
jgi:hypothetical protein